MSRAAVVPFAPRLPNEASRPGGQPLGKLWELFAVHYAPQNGDSTNRNYCRTRERSVSLPDFPAPGDVIVWLSALRACPMADTTIALHRWNLHRLYDWARDAGWTTGNPVALTPFRRPVPKRKGVRDIGSVFEFVLPTAADEREAAHYAVLRYCGVRPSEALGFQREDFDMKRGTVSILRQRSEHTITETTPPKTERAKRVLPLRAPLLPYLKAVLALPNPTVRVGRGGGKKVQVPFLFPYRSNDLGRRMKVLRGLLADTFPDGDAWYVFRHSCAMELRSGGVPIDEISQFLGHVSVDKTETYLRGLLGARTNMGAAFAALDAAHVGQPERRKPERGSRKKVKLESALTLPSFEANSPAVDEEEKFES